MLAAREVTPCYQVTGEVDFLLMVLVQEREAYEAFMRRCLSSYVNLGKFRTLISLPGKSSPRQLNCKG